MSVTFTVDCRHINGAQYRTFNVGPTATQLRVVHERPWTAAAFWQAIVYQRYFLHERLAGRPLPQVLSLWTARREASIRGTSPWTARRRLAVRPLPEVLSPWTARCQAATRGTFSMNGMGGEFVSYFVHSRLAGRPLPVVLSPWTDRWQLAVRPLPEFLSPRTARWEAATRGNFFMNGSLAACWQPATRNTFSINGCLGGRYQRYMYFRHEWLAGRPL